MGTRHVFQRREKQNTKYRVVTLWAQFPVSWIGSKRGKMCFSRARCMAETARTKCVDFDVENLFQREQRPIFFFFFVVFVLHVVITFIIRRRLRNCRLPNRTVQASWVCVDCIMEMLYETLRKVRRIPVLGFTYWVISNILRGVRLCRYTLTPL